MYDKLYRLSAEKCSFKESVEKCSFKKVSRDGKSSYLELKSKNGKCIILFPSKI